MAAPHSKTSKTLNDLVKRDKRIQGYDDERNLGHGYIIYTSPGYCFEDPGLHTYGFDTVKEVLEGLWRIESCQCGDCDRKDEEFYKEFDLS